MVSRIDPGEQKKADKIATAATQTNTLEQIAAEVLEKKRSEGKAQATWKADGDPIGLKGWAPRLPIHPRSQPNSLGLAALF